MSTSVLFAAAAVAVGAYALYTRRYATAQAETAGAKPTFSSFGFKTLKLASAEQVNHNVKRLRFELPDPQATSGLSLTSALLTITFPGGGWLPTPRPYTPVSDLDTKGHLDLLVKQYPNGKASGYLHSLKPGDKLTVLRIPGYKWTPNEQKTIALVAGGQGITPCYQLLRGILRNPADRTAVTLVWGVNTDEDLILRDELAQLQKEHPGRLTTVYVVSDPAPGSPHKKGRVTSEVLQAAGVIPNGMGELKTEGGVGKVFLSGPPAMEKAFTAAGTGVFAELGFSKAEVHKF